MVKEVEVIKEVPVYYYYPYAIIKEVIVEVPVELIEEREIETIQEIIIER